MFNGLQLLLLNLLLMIPAQQTSALPLLPEEAVDAAIVEEVVAEQPKVSAVEDPKVAGDPSELSTLPNASDSETFNEIGWSTYRPQLYFGLKNKRIDSPVFGIAWYRQGQAPSADQITLRHWALHEDNIVFMWSEHNGRDFGRQKLVDQDVGMKTDWFSFGKSSWITQFRIKSAPWNRTMSLVLYLAFQDQNSEMKLLNGTAEGGDKLDFVSGRSDAVGGNFVLKVRNVEGKKLRNSHFSLREEPFVDLVKAGPLIKGALKVQPDGEFGYDNGTVSSPNFVALQIDVKEDTVLEVLFQAEGDEVPKFDTEFNHRREVFGKDFERAFPVSNGTDPVLVKMAHCALSNLLGGIGVWHGSLWMRSAAFHPPNSIKPYGPLRLMSAVPSRTGFPRGFLWDEGHHNLIISRFDPEISLQILSSFLDTMNVNGWIPREIAIGSESEARIPAAYLVQDDSVANPPMFFLLLRAMIGDPKIVQKYQPQLARLYPRMKELYLWLKTIQRGPKPGTFRWRGRNSTTDRDLNPGTLPSGFDDFPRATHPTDEEYHLDLRCWMAVSSNVLVSLASLANDTDFVPQIRAEAALLNDARMLEELHWSEKAQRFLDYGLHSESVKMVNETTPEGQRILVRKVLKEPQYQLVGNVNGYANLFPLLLKLLPANATQLGPLLHDMANPEMFWTPFGLRSLSTQCPYYNTWNNEFESPYWRGNVWININYYALDALRHYASLEGPHRTESARMYTELRQNILVNMGREYERTGFIWEHYNDGDGKGEGQHPFTGWSALVVNILAEIY